MRRINNVYFQKIIGKIFCIAQIINGLPDRPKRRHGNKFRLHQAAGTILRKIKRALEHHALGLRNFLEHFLALIIGHILKHKDSIITVELLHRIDQRVRIDNL